MHINTNTHTHTRACARRHTHTKLEPGDSFLIGTVMDFLCFLLLGVWSSTYFSIGQFPSAGYFRNFTLLFFIPRVFYSLWLGGGVGLPCSFFLWWVSSWQSKNLWIVHFLLHTLLTKSLLPPLLCACLLVLALEPRAFLMPGTHSATRLHSSPLLFCCVRGFPWSVGKHSLLVPIAFPPVCVWGCACVCVVCLLV